MTNASPRPVKTGSRVQLYAVGSVFAVIGMVSAAATLFRGRGPAHLIFPGILLLTGAAFLLGGALLAREVLLDAEGATFRRRAGSVCLRIPWSGYACLYRLEGVKRRLFLLSPGELSMEEQRRIFRLYERTMPAVPEVEGCLILNAFHDEEDILALMPASMRVMPMASAVSL